MVNFPDSFLWGAAIGAHQAEGGDFASDWWRWEQRRGRIRGGGTSETAAGHFTHFAADFALARKLGLNTVQLSLSWARIQPEEDRFDDAALGHYASVMATLQRNGLAPLCVLQEVAAPEWFTGGGGWERPDAARCFARYTERAATHLGSRCQRWIPIFEAEYWLGQAYGARRWPGRPASGARRRRAVAGIVAAHRKACEVLHGAGGNRVGLAVRGLAAAPENPHSPWDLRAARTARNAAHHGLAGPMTKQGGGEPAFDFICLSLLEDSRLRFSPWRPGDGFARRTAQSGPPAPQHWEPLFEDLGHYGRPFFASTGIATDDDGARRGHLLGHIEALRAARAAGVDIEGFIWRSLLDGFEWDQGDEPRWGLIHVDRVSLQRTPNKSAFLLKKICGGAGK